jgi:hypothetical protein
MTIATGIGKQLRYKKESTWGTLPGASGAQSLRRVTSNLDLKKATYESKEIRPDYQKADFRHGMRSVDGTISGELSCGTYADFMATVCRQAWQSLVTTGALLTNVLSAAGVLGSSGTITRSTGSFLTDGFKIGDVVRCTNWTTTGVNLNSRNLWITSLTATVMTAQFLDGTTFPTKASESGLVTIVQAGKKNWMATSSQTNDSYSIEHWFSDILQSETFTGCRINDMDIKLPSTGMATIDTGFMGKDMVPINGSAYFTSPTAVTTSGVLAAVNGALYVAGVQVGLVTGMNIKMSGGMTSGEVIGSNTRPDIFAGGMDVSGQMTVYFTDNVMRDLFVNETEASLCAVFTANNTATSDFMAFTLPRIKVGGASKDDGEKGLIMTMPFTGLLNVAGGTGVSSTATTISIQDSLAP